MKKRDGRLVPFEADKISQSLFAATEERGEPNAFLARELCDGVVHFLVQDVDGAEPSTEQIADLVIKVTRELGYPELALAFSQRRERRRAVPKPEATEEIGLPFALDDEPSTVSRRTMIFLERKAVHTRDLVSVMDEGLLEACLEGRPGAIEALVVEPPLGDASWGDAVLAAIARTRAEAGRFILDGADHGLEAHQAASWLRQLCVLREGMDREAVLNLHAAPPAWAQTPAGPLFGASPERGRANPDEVGLALLAELAKGPCGSERVAIDWHVSDGAAGDVAAVMRLTGDLSRLRLVLDRRGQPVALAEGLNRSHPALLMEIGLGLPKFLRHAGVDGEVGPFLDKLPSLVRMAVDVAFQKRRFLTRRLPRDAALLQGFLLHRARLVLRPHGLAETVCQLLGRPPGESREATELGRRILHTMIESSQRHGQARNVDVGICVTCPDTPGGVAERWATTGAHVTVNVSRQEPTNPDRWQALLSNLLSKTRVARIALQA